MAQETIEAIRQAEASAEAAEKEAANEAEAIVAEAKANAEEEARAQGEQMLAEAGAEESRALQALQDAVAQKQQKAVEVILTELL